MKVIRVIFVQTWRPARNDPPDGTVLEDYQCATAEEAEWLIESLHAKYWHALDKTSIQVYDVERCPGADHARGLDGDRPQDESRPMPHTTDGYIITPIEQAGKYTGADMGRLWFQAPGRHSWTWFGGFADLATRAAILARAQTMTFAEFAAWWDTDEPVCSGQVLRVPHTGWRGRGVVWGGSVRPLMG